MSRTTYIVLLWLLPQLSWVCLSSRIAADVKELTEDEVTEDSKIEDDDCRSPKNPGCNHLAGKCCPHGDGTMLACCSHDSPTPSHPVDPHRTPVKRYDGPVKLKYYAYRAVNGAYDGTAAGRYTWGLYGISCNLANAAGVLRYVHNEIVGRHVSARAKPPMCERGHGIDRIIRLTVTMHTTQAVYDKAHGQFMPFGAIDGQKYTVPGYDKLFEEYGYAVGCQGGDGAYPGAAWYSFPAEGMCMFPSGGSTCTYTYSGSGSITLDQLTGIDKLGGYKKFCMDGGVEFNGPRSNDDGVTIDFWKDYHDKEKNQNRTEALLKRFDEAAWFHPDHEEPRCDTWR